MSAAALSVMVIGVFAAGVIDVRTRRIPNVLTGALAAVALAANVPNGLMSVAAAALVMALAFAAGTVAFSLGWFGGGDVKLLAACCGFAGYPAAIELVLYTFIAGGVLSLFEAIRKRRLVHVLTGAYHTTVGMSPASQVTVPYGVAIAAGSCAYALSFLPAFGFLRLHL